MDSPKIMIIDDEVKLAKMTKVWLDNNGYSAIVLDSPLGAIERIKEEMPDLILLDIMMPHMDGYQLKDEIKTDSDLKDIPIMMFTAKQSESEVMSDAQLTHVVEGFISKPYDLDDLLEKIKSILQKKSNE